MTKRYPFGRALGRGNPCDPRHFERIALRGLQASNLLQSGARDVDEPVGHGRALGRRLRRNVHHRHLTTLLVMRQLCHLSRRARVRSEEHTSELQSLAYLVCRLLLEKKKNKESCTSA